MGSPLRILHVVVNMNRGGAETLIMNLYRNVDRSKVQFDFLTCKEGVFDQEIKAMGGIVHRIPYISDVGYFKYVKAIEEFFFENLHYKVVHSHMDKMSGLVLQAANKAHIPIRISHSHNTSSEGAIGAKCFKWYAGRFIIPNATHYFACSNQASNWLFGKRGQFATILKNGIDVDKFKYSDEIRLRIREELNLRNDYFVIGHVGRFNRQKNHSFLIAILEEIVKINSNSILVLIGDGTLKNEIKEKVEVKGLQKNVMFLGVRSNVHELLQSFDVLTFPSLHEGLPVTLIEAQGIGIPCVISDVITNEVDVGAGLINYESLNNSPKKWAKKILLVQKELNDTSLYIKNNGYDITKSALWLENYYLNLIRNRQKIG